MLLRMKDTIPHLYSLLASVKVHLRPFPQHGFSRDHVVRHSFAYNWWNIPSELCDFHSQSRGRCWYFRTALETLSMQIRGTVISLPLVREYWTLWSHNLTVDPRRIYLTPQDLTSWSQPYRDDKCTKQLYSVGILPVNYKRMINRHARRIDPSTTCWQLASEARLVA